jgi:hypothetical protein
LAPFFFLPERKPPKVPVSRAVSGTCSQSVSGYANFPVRGKPNNHRRQHTHFGRKPSLIGGENPGKRELITRGIPMGLQMIFSTASVLVLISLINAFGSETAAAFGAVNQIISYIQMPGIAARDIHRGTKYRGRKLAARSSLCGRRVRVQLVIYRRFSHVMHVFPDGDFEIAEHIVSTTF